MPSSSSRSWLTSSRPPSHAARRARSKARAGPSRGLLGSSRMRKSASSRNAPSSATRMHSPPLRRSLGYPRGDGRAPRRLGVGQPLADVPALAQAFVVGVVDATRLDPRQRLQPWADASQVGDGRILGRIELLRQVRTRPWRRTLPLDGCKCPASRRASSDLPTPLRPTSPVCRVSKVSSRSENRRLPSGSWKETPSSVRVDVFVMDTP